MTRTCLRLLPIAMVLAVPAAGQTPAPAEPAAPVVARSPLPTGTSAAVYLGADPAKEGKMDFEGMMAGYTQFFGTPEQPNKPARTTVQVVLPAGVRGALIEIDLIAVRREKPAGS